MIEAYLVERSGAFVLKDLRRPIESTRVLRSGLHPDLDDICTPGIRIPSSEPRVCVWKDSSHRMVVL